MAKVVPIFKSGDCEIYHELQTDISSNILYQKYLKMCCT